MDEWYRRARHFNPGEKQDFERWFWSTPLPLPPLAPPILIKFEDSPNLNVFPCFYHGCPKQTDPYRSKQSRNNHFDSTHIGARFFCPKCDEEFRNKGSVRRHQIRFAHWD
ncbi:hypothetical protein C8J55DRAFT_71225 [Lentinula edodes]|uniref:C2H2-type domain-containing protein n=1 Tax=Lentinula lateritia TaxID=40482 RepID=A0A9W9AC67_9AGAR|nr:hypothetical protein C8J55DRAFT_71225 [Lentinula edodes]